MSARPPGVAYMRRLRWTLLRSFRAVSTKRGDCPLKVDHLSRGGGPRHSWSSSIAPEGQSGRVRQLARLHDIGEPSRALFTGPIASIPDRICHLFNSFMNCQSTHRGPTLHPHLRR
jgi:hypothetical protein